MKVEGSGFRVEGRGLRVCLRSRRQKRSLGARRRPVPKWVHRGTSLIRNNFPVGLDRRALPGFHCGPGGVAPSYERGTPVRVEGV